MKLALIGRGNTGSEIEKLILESEEHQLVSVSTRHSGLDLKGIKQADVVIDFSSPDGFLQNLKTCANLGKNMVVGTSGWYDNLNQVKKIVKDSGIGLIYGQNFAVGTNIFFKLISYAAKMCAKYGNYDVYGFEVHHKGKKDSPSGTAFKIADQILANFPAKKRLQTQRLDRKIEPDELHFASVRGGRNPGMHQVVFDSEGDSITLSDANHSRRGYAEGALMAAQFIKGKKGLYSFDELFK